MGNRLVTARHAVAALALTPVLAIAASALIPEKAPFWLQAVAGEAALVGVVLLVSAAGRLEPRDALFLRTCRWWLPLLSIAGAVALHWMIRAAAPFVMALLQSLGLDFKEEVEKFDREVRGEWSRAPAAVLLLLALVPAFCEEALFRGLMLSGFRRSIGPWKALFVTGIVFGLIHVLPIRIAYTVPLGLFFGYAVLRSGSLWAGVAAHLTNNVLALVVEESWPLDFVLGVVAFPIFVAVVAGMWILGAGHRGFERRE